LAQPDHLARFIVEVIDGLDLSNLIRQSAGRGSKAHHPATLLAILVYGSRDRHFFQSQDRARHLRLGRISLYRNLAKEATAERGEGVVIGMTASVRSMWKIERWLSRIGERKPITVGLELGVVRQLCLFRCDPDIQLLLENSSITAHSDHPHYALMAAGIHPALRNSFKKTYNIEILEFDPADNYAEFGSTLAVLAELVESRREEQLNE
jgi:hypothetical protein